MNFVNKSLAGREMRGRVEASRRVEVLVEASLLLALDLFAGLWAPANSSYFSTGLDRGLMQGLRQAQDPGSIAMELKNKECDVVLLNGLADSLGMEFLEL